MKLSDFERWHPFDNLARMYHFDKVEHGIELTVKLKIAQGYGDKDSARQLQISFSRYSSYMVTDESYSDGFWSSDPTDVWTFYRSYDSPYINYLKESSMLFADTVKNATHYAFVTTESVVHVVSDVPPFLSQASHTGLMRRQ